MTKPLKTLAAFVVALLALGAGTLLPAMPVQAATQPESDSIGYYVRAVLPENQMDPNLTYFDLRMQPGQTQTLEVEVVNEGTEAITVDISAISASTNRNGIIDYKTPNIRDKTLKIPFSDIAVLEGESLTVGPLSTAVARVTLAMPAESYDGVVLGGLVFTKQQPGGTGDSSAMLQNVYSYVIGVKLSETGAVVNPDFELDVVKPGAANYLPVMVHGIRNKAAAIAKGVTLDITVRDEAGNIHAQLHKANVDMAPNSVMPVAVEPGQGTENAGNGQLVPGNYTTEVRVEHGDQSWTFEQQFTIGSVEAETINTEMPGAAPEKSDGTLLLIILLAGAGAAVLLLALWVALLLRRKKQTEARERQVREKLRTHRARL